MTSDGKFISLSKEDLHYIADKAEHIGDGTGATNGVILEINNVQSTLEGFYYQKGKLVLTDKPVRPRND